MSTQHRSPGCHKPVGCKARKGDLVAYEVIHSSSSAAGTSRTATWRLGVVASARRTGEVRLIDSVWPWSAAPHDELRDRVDVDRDAYRLGQRRVQTAASLDAAADEIVRSAPAEFATLDLLADFVRPHLCVS